MYSNTEHKCNSEIKCIDEREIPCYNVWLAQTGSKYNRSVFYFSKNTEFEPSFIAISSNKYTSFTQQAIEFVFL